MERSRTRGYAGRHRSDETRVVASAEYDPGRHLGTHPQPYRVEQQTLEFFEQFFFAGNATIHRLRQIPVRPYANGIRPQLVGHRASLRQLLHAAEDARVARDVSERKILIEGEVIDGRSKLWILHERFEFRGEGKTSAAMAVKERFFPRAVSREEQPLAVEIEQCEGEHSVQLLQAIEIP